MKFSRLNIGTLTMWTILFAAAIAIVNVKFALSIVVPEDSVLPIKINGSRAFINPKDRELYTDERQLKRTIPCLVQFVDAYFNFQPERIPVLLPENVTDTLAFAQLYLSALQQITSTYVVSGDFDQSVDNPTVTTLNGIIMFEDYDELMSMKSGLINLCGRDCRYLVVLTRTFPNEASFLSECARLVSELWKRRIANVVFLSAVGHKVLVSRSLTFQPDSVCYPAEPVLVGECDENSKWSVSEWNAVSEMYLPLRMNNCIVTIAFFDYEPFATSRKGNVTSSSDIDNFGNTTSATSMDTDVLEITGIEGEIINTLASNLNFVISAREVPWVNGTSIAEEVNEVLWATEEVDMVLGGLIWAPVNETVYTLPYEVIQIVWLIPIRPHVSLQGLVSPLTNNVWYAVIGIIIFASCIEFILSRNVAFLEILSLVIGVAWPKQPTIFSARIRFMSWVIFGYLMTQFYLASLAGQLMSNVGWPIDTLAELADSSFNIEGNSDTAQLFDNKEIENDPEDIIDNQINRIISKRFKVVEQEDYQKSFHDLINEKRDNLALAVRMNVSSMTPSFEGKRVHRMKEAIASYPLSFAVWRGMPYLSVLDKKISSLTEGGIIGYWARHISFKDGGYFDTDSGDDENFLNLRSLVPGFLLLSIGYGLGAFALLLEIAVFQWQNRKAAKIKTLKSKENKKMERIKRKPPVTMTDRKIGRKLPDVMDTKAWIELLNNRQQYQTPIRRQAERKEHFPFEFVH